MDSTAARQLWRKDYVTQFLKESGVAFSGIAAPTQKHLDQWARQVQLVTDQPSANWENVVLQLCKAVESELACSIGQIKGLEFLANQDAIGRKAHGLKNKLEDSTKQRLEARGIKPGFVSSELPRLLKNLADLRSDTDSAHGSVEIRTATMNDAQKVRHLAGVVLKGLASK